MRRKYTVYNTERAHVGICIHATYVYCSSTACSPHVSSYVIVYSCVCAACNNLLLINDSWFLLCFCVPYRMSRYRCCACHFDSPSWIEMVVVVLWHACVLDYFSQCIRSQSNWYRSLSKRMSVSSSHLDSSCPHTSSHSKPLSSEVPGTRWFPTDCHHNISGFLYTHWSCSCHNVHSQCGSTNPTWIWVPLLWTHSYNWQW